MFLHLSQVHHSFVEYIQHWNNLIFSYVFCLRLEYMHFVIRFLDSDHFDSFD